MQSYTNGQRILDVPGTTVNEVLHNLNETYPGIKFRFINEQGHIRDHMNIFLNKQQIQDLSQPITETDEIFILQAVSGG